MAKYCFSIVTALFLSVVSSPLFSLGSKLIDAIIAQDTEATTRILGCKSWQKSNASVFEIITSHYKKFDGKTLLHGVALDGCVEIMRQLLARVGNPEKVVVALMSKDDAFNTPLHDAVWYRQDTMVKEILSQLYEAGGQDAVDDALAALDSYDNMPLHTAIKAGSKLVVRSLLAAYKNREAVIEVLNLADVHGNTSMHYAVWCGFYDVVEEILKKIYKLGKQAAVDVALAMQDKQGNTPLHTAAKRDLLEIAELLLDWGADSSFTNNRNERPCQMRGISRDMCALLYKNAKKIVSSIAQKATEQVSVTSEQCSPSSMKLKKEGELSASTRVEKQVAVPVLAEPEQKCSPMPTELKKDIISAPLPVVPEIVVPSRKTLSLSEIEKQYPNLWGSTGWGGIVVDDSVPELQIDPELLASIQAIIE